MTVLKALMTVLDAEHARAVIEHRNAKRARLTVYGAKLLAQQFSRWRDPNEAADEMILRGWQGFKPEWIRDRQPEPTSTVVDSRFEKLWNTYPIKDVEDYCGALASFHRAMDRGEGYDFILAAAGWVKAALPPIFDPTYRERAKFIPSLAKWLDERRFEAKRDAWRSVERKRAGQ